MAGRHGDVRVKKLFEELQPGFELLEGCHLDDPVYRDVANFVMQRIKPAVVPTTAANNQPATKMDNGRIPRGPNQRGSSRDHQVPNGAGTGLNQPSFTPLGPLLTPFRSLPA